ncbi:MAG: phosphoribosyltransferase [Calditrichaeota bacterium]|nr:MAG: phosphoribosyltransferase [Calditrichota bacterium]
MGTMELFKELFSAFENREEAGQLLAKKLEHLKDKKPVILGLPRGGVIVAHEIATALNTELDVVLARKLGAPDNPELAIGAISEAGKVQLNYDIIETLGIPEEYIEMEKERQMEEIRRRAEIYRKVHPKIPLDGRVVVITDDGVATGATMKAAILGVQTENPEKIVLAIPVGAQDVLDELQKMVDELVYLKNPPFIGGVGQFYVDFSQIDDNTVVNILQQS